MYRSSTADYKKKQKHKKLIYTAEIPHCLMWGPIVLWADVGPTRSAIWVDRSSALVQKAIQVLQKGHYLLIL